MKTGYKWCVGLFITTFWSLLKSCFLNVTHFLLLSTFLKHGRVIVCTPCHFVIVLTVANPLANPIDFTTASTSTVELSWTAVISFYLTVKLFRQMRVYHQSMTCSVTFFIRCGRLTNCSFMKTWRLVRCENNSLVIGFIGRWSLSPLVPYVYSDVGLIFHCLLLSPWKWTIIFCKLISTTHRIAH